MLSPFSSVKFSIITFASCEPKEDNAQKDLLLATPPIPSSWLGKSAMDDTASAVTSDKSGTSVLDRNRPLPLPERPVELLLEDFLDDVACALSFFVRQDDA